MSGSSTTQAGKSGHKYELTVLYVPCDADKLSDAITRTVYDAEKTGFAVTSMDIAGKKMLAYPIRAKSGKVEPKGIYAYFTLSGDGSAMGLSQALDLEDLALRYLLVTVDKKF